MGFENGFTIVPNEAWQHPHLSKEARIVYAVLCRYRDHEEATAFPSIDTLSSVSTCSRSTVSKAIRELWTFGLVEITKRRNGSVFNNSYYLPEPQIDGPPYWIENGDTSEYIDRRERRRTQSSEAARKAVLARQSRTVSDTPSTAHGTQPSTVHGTGPSTAHGTQASTVDGTVSDQCNRPVEQTSRNKEGTCDTDVSPHTLSIEEVPREVMLELQREYISKDEPGGDFTAWAERKLRRVREEVVKGK